MPKKTETGELLKLFNIHSVSEHQKKLKGEPLGKFFSKKSLTMPKTERGTLQSLLVLYVTRKNIKNFFGSVR